MESWNYVSHGKGFAFDETVLPSNTATKSRNFDMCWEPETPSSYEDQGFGESDFPGMTQKRFLEDSFRNGSMFCGGGTIASPLMADPSLSTAIMASQNPFSGEAESNSRESSLIDLKLGGFTDCIEAPISSRYNSKVNPNLSSPELTTPTKIMQASNLNSLTPFCQVLGCNKDLSASKGYHKRHRVCEVHSKTDKVVVNGIEQRFCQQCSRFHLLGDFDNGKRSCRKRLAGHNERRRKPKAGISSRTGRFLQPNDGNIFHRTALTTSFICQDGHRSGLLHSKKYETDSCYSSCNKFETDYSPRLAIPPSNPHLHPKHAVASNNFKKQYSFVHGNGTNTTTGSIYSENSNHCLHNLGPPNSVSRSLFHNTTQQDRDGLFVFDTASSFQAFPGVPESGCALSLLSPRSQDAMHSIGTSLTSPMIVSSGHGHYNVSQVYNTNSGVGPQTSISHPLSNVFPSLGMGSAEGYHFSSFLLSDGDRDAGSFEDAGGVFQGSDSMNAKDWFSCEDGATIDLLQLSLQLHQVEHQKHSLQVKQENDAFCCLKIT